MKIAKGVSWFLFGCLSALVLAACINPVSSITEGRQQNASDGSAALTVKSVAYNREYEFLLLMGHWNRDYANESGDTYLYTPDLPTLLAAGKQTAKITAANNTVSILMYPLVVDTTFTRSTITVGAKLKGASLIPGSAWKLNWKINNSLYSILNGAQRGTELFASITGTGAAEDPANLSRSGQAITLSIGTLAKGNEGYANFNLEYAPFSLNDAVWNGFDNLTALNLKIGKPVWIIRNGANDVAQDPDTTTFGSIGADGKVAEKPDWNGTTKNGNGAVTFKVLDPAGDEDNDKYPNGWEVENGYDPVDENSWPEGGIGIKGAGDNATISEENLLDVLGVSTVAKAIEELHKRLNNEGTTGPYLDGLRLGMYLDLPSLTPTGEDTIIMPDSYYPNLRIVIASFDQYKGMMGNNDTRHIKFVFKNSPVEKKMRSIESNYGGYPYATNDKTHGTPELKEYLEGPFFDGLKKALGCNYFYRVTRNITGGNKTDGWKTVSFSAEIFIDTEMEVLGNNEYSKLTTEGDLPQTALYRTNAAPGKIWKIKLYGTNPKSWWFATPKSNMNYVFCAGMMNGSAGGAASNYYDLLGVVPAFCIQ